MRSIRLTGTTSCTFGLWTRWKLNEVNASIYDLAILRAMASANSAVVGNIHIWRCSSSTACFVRNGNWYNYRYNYNIPWNDLLETVQWWAPTCWFKTANKTSKKCIENPGIEWISLVDPSPTAGWPSSSGLCGTRVRNEVHVSDSAEVRQVLAEVGPWPFSDRTEVAWCPS